MKIDPVVYINEFLQNLIQKTNPIGVFLGAGCPCSIKCGDKPLIPDISGITSNISKSARNAFKNNWRKIIKELKTEGISDPNIENILSRIRSLRNIVGNNEILGWNSENLENFENELCNKIKKNVEKKLPSKNGPYHYLARWIGSIDRENPIEVFTTNYDLLMESALCDCKIPYFDGFIGSPISFFDLNEIEYDKLPSHWARLWKIHGSINWWSEETDSGINVSRTDSVTEGEMVIHPTHLKYDQSRKMPYLAMMDRLRKFLNKTSSSLITIGYSYGDQHLNDIISQTLFHNPLSTVFALMYGNLDESHNVVKIAEQRRNLVVIGRDKCVIGTKILEWSEKPESNNLEIPENIISWKNGSSSSKTEVFLGDFLNFGLTLRTICQRSHNG